MKKKIDITEYNIIPIPPYLSPYSTRISELLQKKPASAQEADEISEEINLLMQKLLDKTVHPKPTEEHQLTVFNVLVDITNAVINEAAFFRKSQGPSSAKSSSTRSSPTSQTE